MRRRNEFSKDFVQNHLMKNHIIFYWEITRMKLSKKHFLKHCYFSFKKFIGRSLKEFKEVFGQKHPNKKSYQFLVGKTWQKETLKKQCGRTAWFQKKSSLERRCNKSVGFYALFGVVGGFAEWKKGMHFGSASVGFYALFGLVGEVCGAEKGHAFWSKSVDFHALFGLVGRFAARKKGMHFGARVWISMNFLGFLEEAAAWKKGNQFEVSGRGWRRKLFYLIPLICFTSSLWFCVISSLWSTESWGAKSLKKDTCWRVVREGQTA